MGEPPTFIGDWIPANNQHFTVTTSPHNDVIGYFALGSSPFATKFPVYYKPTPEQIENHRTMLGWEWRDAE